MTSWKLRSLTGVLVAAVGACRTEKPDLPALLPPETPPPLEAVTPPDVPPPAMEPEAEAEGEPEFAGEGEGDFGEADASGIELTGACAALGCAIQISFSQTMVGAGNLSAAPLPKIGLSPEYKGKWTWQGPSALNFALAPGTPAWGHTLTVSVPELTPVGQTEVKVGPWEGSFTLPYLAVAGKVAYWPVVLGQPQFVAFLNGSSGQIGRGPLVLVYDQKVSLDQVKANLQVTDTDGNPVPVRVTRPASLPLSEGSELAVEQTVAVTLTKPPADGALITLSYPTWPGGDLQPSVAELTVRSEFSLRSQSFIGEPDWSSPLTSPLPQNVDLVLDFSGVFSLPELNRALQVTPAPRNLYVSQEWTRARIRMELEPGRSYQAKLSKTFTDTLGNPLAAALDLRFQAKDLPPFLEAATSPLLLEAGAARLPVRGRNLGSLTVTSLRVDDPRLYARAVGRQASSCAKLGLTGKGVALSPPAAEPAMNTIGVFDIAMKSEPGLYCLDLETKGRGSEAKGKLATAALAQVSDIALTTKVFAESVLVWTTRLSKPAPLAKTKVLLLDEQGKTLGEGETDATGVVTLAAKGIATATGLTRPVLVVAQNGGDTALLPLSDRSMASPYQFGMRGAVADKQPLYAAVFTERGVYRPGETVYLKILAPGAAKELTVHIQDPRGQQALKKSLRLDANYGANTELVLGKQAAVGEYLVNVSAGTALATRKFKVEEYRVPTFEVKVTGGLWQRGNKARATLEAKYLHGGALSGRSLRYEVRREAEPFAPAGFSGFVFNVPSVQAPNGVITSGEGFLDDSGTREVEFVPDHASAVGPMRYTVEGVATDLDRQAYSGRLTRTVHPAAFYVGLRPPSRAVLQAGDSLDVPVVVVTPEGKVVAGVPVRAKLERIDHHTTARLAQGTEVQVTNREVPVPQDTCLTKSKAGVVLCRFKIDAAGQYRVRAWAQDATQEIVQAGFELAASGDNPAAWPRFDQDRIDVIADKTSYAPGDTAKLIVQSPYPKALALVTMERDHIVGHRVVEIKNDTPAIAIPIDDTFVPNVYVSVVLVRGRVHADKDATGFETGAPGFKMGYANLQVEPVKQTLAVAVTPNHERAAPGSELTVELEAKDHEGRPAAGQATLWLVDEAVLGLTGFRTPDARAQIYAERALGVRTGESRLDLPHAKRSRREQVFPSGDGEEGEEASGIVEEGMLLRKLFKTTAYWNPSLAVDASGKARVTLTLPDNLTTYRIMAVVADARGRVGSAANKVVLSRPLMVQPVLPRFVYPEDELTIEALAFNATSDAGEVQLAAELAGLTPIRGQPSERITVAPGKSGSLKLHVRVSGRGDAKVRFVAKMGKHTDAVEAKLPILHAGTARQLVASHSVTGTQSIPIELPADRVADTTRVEIVASTTTLTELKDAVQYLMQYPNGCIEQTTSTAYPLLVLKDLLPEIGVTVSMDQLQKYSEAGVKRILSFQTEGGGLSYWPGGRESHAFATAFGLTALIEAKKRGYDVPQPALDKMANYLEATLKRGEIREDIPHGGMADGDSRALFVMTLGRLGRPQPAYITTLWESRSKLTAFGLSFLAIAATELKEDHPLVEPILAEVRRVAKEETEEAYFAGEPKGGWSFDSPLRTHATALLAYADADAASDMTGKLLSGLLKRRRYGMWGNTQENVFGIMGVYTVATASPTASGGANLELRVNNRPVADAEMEKVSGRVRRLVLNDTSLGAAPGKAAKASLTLTNRASLPVILTVRTQYEVPLTQQVKAPPEAKGFTYQRTYETLDGKSLEGKTIPLGSLVRVRLHVVGERKLNYVAIDDKLPAGLEPLNTALATTERVSLGALSDVELRSQALLSYSEMRDHRVAFYVDDMPAGEYQYSYVARATTPGKFLRPSGRVEAMYETDVHGTTAIDAVTVK